jgi:hypothetical protein
MSFKWDDATADLNQYWYSPKTIDVLVSEIQMQGTKVAFLSCPSLYFALTDGDLRSRSKLFEFDRQWESDTGFVFYDFNHPDKIPVGLWDAFDLVVVDPPFITREVWAKYAETIRLIAAKGCKFLFTSVIENQAMLEELVETSLLVPEFQPSIPKLVYQYHCFVSFPPARLNSPNEELPPEDPTALAARSLANDLRESQNAFAAQVQGRNREGEVPLQVRAISSSDADPAMKWTYVPEGLREYPEGQTGPDAATETDYGEEYRAVEAKRNKMTQLRALVDDVIKTAEAALKPYASLESETDEVKRNTAADKVAQCEKLKAAKLDEVKAVAAEIAHLDLSGVDRRTVCALMSTFVDDWQAPLKAKDQYMEKCADATRLYKSPIFNRQKELLAELKAIKKARN